MSYFSPIAAQFYKLPSAFYLLIKYELDCRIYHFGDSFIAGHPLPPQSIKKRLTLKLHKLYPYLRLIFSPKRGPKRPGEIRIMTASYFSINKKLKIDNAVMLRPPWAINRSEAFVGSYHSLCLTESIAHTLKRGSFNELIHPDFQKKVEILRVELKRLYKSYELSAGIFPNDMTFFELLSIQVLKELGIPTFVYLHGLPGIYNSVNNNKADYLIVWGPKIKEHYVSVGVSPKKIITVKHLELQNLDLPLRNSLQSILVLSKARPGVQFGETIDAILTDRGQCLVYLWEVQRALENQGVKSATLRLHPSENPKWYQEYLSGFYKLEKPGTIDEALAKASLVIGPTSSVFLEALNAGVNYFVYEPGKTGFDYFNYPLVPPFDGSDTRVPLALNPVGLESLLKQKPLADRSILKDYLSGNRDLEMALMDVLKSAVKS